MGKNYLLPAETEIPAPATTTILRRLWSTLSNMSIASCCPVTHTSPNSESTEGACSKSRCLVNLGFGSIVRLRFAGGAPSGWATWQMDESSSSVGRLVSDRSCDAGDGR